MKDDFNLGGINRTHYLELLLCRKISNRADFYLVISVRHIVEGRYCSAVCSLPANGIVGEIK